MRLEGGWVVNVPPAGFKLLEVTIDLSVVDVTIPPPSRNPLGGWGECGYQTSIYMLTYLCGCIFLYIYIYICQHMFGNRNLIDFFGTFLSLASVAILAQEL